MMLRLLCLAPAFALLAAGAGAQPFPPPPPPAMPAMTPGALQADLVVKAGSDTVYFSPRGYALDANAIATLTAQARWLVANPFVNIRLEGHGGERDTRDYAIALGDRRANAVRDFLVLQGVAPHRIIVFSWGKERPGSMRVGPTTVSVGPRVRTVIR
jgi:peptidoglycan-associated lipoprotein